MTKRTCHFPEFTTPLIYFSGSGLQFLAPLSPPESIFGDVTRNEDELDEDDVIYDVARRQIVKKPSKCDPIIKYLLRYFIDM